MLTNLRGWWPIRQKLGAEWAPFNWRIFRGAECYVSWVIARNTRRG